MQYALKNLRTTFIAAVWSLESKLSFELDNLSPEETNNISAKKTWLAASVGGSTVDGLHDQRRGE